MSFRCTVLCLENVYDYAFDFWCVEQFSELSESRLPGHNPQFGSNKILFFLIWLLIEISSHRGDFAVSAFIFCYWS